MNTTGHIKNAFGSIKLLPKQLQVKTRWLQMLSIFIALLDILGLGSMVPVLVLAIDHNFIEKSSKLRALYQFLGFTSEPNFLLFLIVAIFLFFVSKNVFAYWVQRNIGKLGDRVCIYLSKCNFDHAFKKAFYNRTNEDGLTFTDELMFNSFYFVSGVFIPSMVIISEFSVVVFMVVLFCIYKPIMFLPLALFLGISVLLVLFYFKNKNEYLGKEIGELREKNIASIQYGVQGFLDIRNYRAQSFFKKQFMKNYVPYVQKGTLSNIIQLIPSRILEIITMLGIIVLVVYAYFLSDNIGEARAVAVMFVIAVFRLLPAANKLMLASIKIKLNGYTIAKIKKNEPYSNQKEIKYPETLHISNINYGYDEPLVITGTMELTQGKIIGIAGHSGIGKTTFLHALQGYVPSSMQLNDNITLEQIENDIAFLGQNHFVFSGTVAQNVAMQETLNETQLLQVKEALKFAHFDTEKALDSWLNAYLQNNGENLSEGQKQRLSIARLVYANKKIVLLDEPTSALDTENENGIIELLKHMASQNKFVVIVAHSKKILDICNRVYRIKDKRLEIDNE